MVLGAVASAASALIWWAGFLALVPYLIQQAVLGGLLLWRRKQSSSASAKSAAAESPAVRLRTRYSRGPRVNCHTASLGEARQNRRSTGLPPAVLSKSSGVSGGGKKSDDNDGSTAASETLGSHVSCKWALVTGASSGVGRALTEQLAIGGFSVVMVALDARPNDAKLLDESVQEMREKYGSAAQEFRRVGCDLGRAPSEELDYMQIIAKATDDIDVQCVFNNAGYILQGSLGRFDDGPVRANHECNVTAPLRITRHFMKRMLEAALPGCIAFTSSAQAFMPLPTAAQYTAGKAYLTAAASCLAAEGAAHGIDICAIQSGPIATRFSENMPKISVVKFYDMISETPDTVAETLLSSIGVVTVRDSSLYTAGTRVLMSILGVNALEAIIGAVLPYTAEFKMKKAWG